MKYTITAITDWEEDTAMMHGDASHVGWRDVQRLLERERVKKIDNGKAKGLPFTCEAESEEDAIDKYNEAHCESDYLKATEADFDYTEDPLAKAGTLVDAGIAVDLPNMLFELYEKVTGKEPVLAEGGHTAEFESWYINMCRVAWVCGFRTLEEFAVYLNKFALGFEVELKLAFQ